MPVFYATDREQNGDGQFTGTRTKDLKYGLVHVKMPHDPDRKRGSFESCGVFDDRERECVIMYEEKAFKNMDTLLQTALAYELEDPNDALVYIHGYNTGFKEAVYRAAQISYDIPHKGLTMTYSWASVGKLDEYLTDRVHSQLTQSNLAQFLRSIAKQKEMGHLRKVTILAHSMGTRALSLALKEFKKPTAEFVFDHIVFAAPDIDRDVFFEQLRSGVVSKTKRLTVYTSSEDKALGLSENLWGNRPRLGRRPVPYLIGGKVEFIDASKVAGENLGFGHAYFASKLLDDIHYLKTHDLPADERSLKAYTQGNYRYWELPETE